jgi:hypothetical protein
MRMSTQDVIEELVPIIDQHVAIHLEADEIIQRLRCLIEDLDKEDPVYQDYYPEKSP